MKNKKTTVVACYGTLMKGYNNNYTLSDSKLLGVGKTKDMMIMTEAGIPFVSDKKQVSKIHVEVYEVNEDTLFRLDQLEGHPRFYERKITEIEIEGGGTAKAWMYYCDRLSNRIIESGDFRDKYRNNVIK